MRDALLALAAALSLAVLTMVAACGPTAPTLPAAPALATLHATSAAPAAAAMGPAPAAVDRDIGALNRELAATAGREAELTSQLKAKEAEKTAARREAQLAVYRQVLLWLGVVAMLVTAGGIALYALSFAWGLPFGKTGALGIAAAGGAVAVFCLVSNAALDHVALIAGIVLVLGCAAGAYILVHCARLRLHVLKLIP